MSRPPTQPFSRFSKLRKKPPPCRISITVARQTDRPLSKAAPRKTNPSEKPASRWISIAIVAIAVIGLLGFGACTMREMMQVRRDPVRLAFAFLGSALLLLIMSCGISQELCNISFAALDQDHSPESRAVFRPSRILQGSDPSPDPGCGSAAEAPVEREVSVALQIPPGFGADLRRGAGAGHAGAACRAAGAAEPPFCYDAAMASLPAIGPSIPPLLLLLFPEILMAVGVARSMAQFALLIIMVIIPVIMLSGGMGACPAPAASRNGSGFGWQTRLRRSPPMPPPVPCRWVRSRGRSGLRDGEIGA